MASLVGSLEEATASPSIHHEQFVLPISETNIAYIVTAFLFILVASAMHGNKDKLPRYNPKKTFELTTRRVQAEFMPHGQAMIIQARKQYGQEPYRLHSDIGDVIVMPGNAMQELRNAPALEFMEMANYDAHGYLSGFEPFSINNETVRVINRYLTKALAKLTIPLSDEAATALQQQFTDSPEWHEITARKQIARVVSRMSTRIFMGEEMCNNDEWVDSVAAYTRAAFDSANDLRAFPGFTRRVVQWFLPSAKSVRELLPPCQRILAPYVEKRRALKAAARAQGEPEPVFDDAMTWFEKEYMGSYDPAIAQITLSTVAIDTTSDLLQCTMHQLARHPEFIAPLREEVIRVLGTQGLKKVALYNLKFMDSVLKETQRLKPILTGIRRQATAEVKMANGFVIRKGDRIMMDNTRMWNAEYYEDPEKFDPYRFVRWREEAGNENIAHLVSTSDKHMGFGHGEHACPGRFFAANELKLALCHIVLKYEWKLPEGHDPQDIIAGTAMVANPTLRLVIRRREEELDMSSLTE